jgi:PAS domain S-box-containing protein
VSDADRQLTTQLLGERFLPLLAHLILFALLLILMWGPVPHALLAAWGGAVVGVSLIRLVLWDRARRGHMLPSRTARMTRVTMLALGLAWGGGAAFAFLHLPPADTALILLGLTGLIAGGLATLVADRWVFPIYAVAMFLPPLVVLGLIEPDLFDALGVALMAIFLAFSIRLHARAYGSLRERLQVESELRTRERQLASAQAIAHVGSWEWDIPRDVTIWSDELRRMYGVGADAPTGYGAFLERVHPDDRKEIEKFLGDALATGRAVDYEWRCVRPDGTTRNILGRHVVIKDPTGQVVRMAGTSLDITERKEAEENQRTLLRELQASVAEVKVLKGILPICASCKRIRGDGGKWEAVESYVREHTNAEFSHGLCPDCAARDWGTTPRSA